MLRWLSAIVSSDLAEEDSFTVHLPHKQVKFVKNALGLYLYIPPSKQASVDTSQQLGLAQLVNTVDKNNLFHTERQFEQAKRARQLFHALGTPSIRDLKAVIQMNLIKNNPVTTQDVDIAQKIFGADVGALKRETDEKQTCSSGGRYNQYSSQVGGCVTSSCPMH